MLAQLEVRAFRNLEASSQPFAPGGHLILGANGAGKTSLLEAVYLLATTRSFRTSRIGDCCRHGESRFHLAGEVETDRRVRLDLNWDSGQRERLVNGGRASLAEHLSALPVVSWTASDAEVLIGPPATRRRFLDRGVLGLKPSAIEILSRYRQALTEKRQLLQRGGGGIDAWNEVLARAAAALVALRSSYVEQLRLALGSVLEGCRLDAWAIELKYRRSLKSGLEGAPAIAAELAAAREREERLQQPLLGPHRDDLSILWDGHEFRRVASAGERKALGLAMVAAHGKVVTDGGREPVYLLDDADTELDRDRLSALWGAFGAANQLFVTSNRPQVWDGIGIERRWQCSAGRLQMVGSSEDP